MRCKCGCSTFDTHYGFLTVTFAPGTSCAYWTPDPQAEWECADCSESYEGDHPIAEACANAVSRHNATPPRAEETCADCDEAPSIPGLERCADCHNAKLTREDEAEREQIWADGRGC